jgi:hypothetical protein
MHETTSAFGFSYKLVRMTRGLNVFWPMVNLAQIGNVDSWGLGEFFHLIKLSFHRIGRKQIVINLKYTDFWLNQSER